MVLAIGLRINTLLAIAGVGLALLGCQKVDLDELDTLNGRVELIGHGGSGFERFTNQLQSNSMPSIQYATEVMQVDGIEIDIQFSSDTVPLLYHDELLNSSTNCDGYVFQRSWQSLSTCYYNDLPADQLSKDNHLVSLEQLFTYTSSLSNPPRVYLDLKILNSADVRPTNETFSTILSDLIKNYNATNYVRIISPDTSFLNTYKQIQPAIELFLDTKVVDQNLGVASSIGLTGFTTSNAAVSEAQVEAAHAANLEVIIFGLKSRQGHRVALLKSPDGIMTDNVLLLKKMLER